MLQPTRIQNIALQTGDGRHLRYVLKPDTVYENDPFIILADDKFAHNTFADHPHAGIQTVTYVLEGSLTHYDSKTAGGGKLQEGDFQMMTAGRGIIHNENPDKGEEVRVLQLWVNLSSEHKKVDGFYEDILKGTAPVVTFEGGTAEVFAGSLEGQTSPLKLYTPYTYVVFRMQAGATYTLQTEANYNHYAYMLDGEGVVSGESVKAFDLLTFGHHEDAQSIQFTAESDMEFVYFAGEPIKQPIVAQGPFVMNTQQEIQEKFLSYRSGTFLDGTPY